MVPAIAPLQNRVLPTGEIVADPGRGTLTGNRGCLHGTGRDLGVSRWRSKLWICCVLDWRGRRADYLSYVEAWRAGYAMATRPKAVEMDAVLHRQRVDSRTRRQITRPARAGDLPDGVMVKLGDGVGLLRGGTLRPWSFAGYGPPVPLAPDTPVDLLTPPASVTVLRAGYRPPLHPSATRSWTSVGAGAPTDVQDRED